MGRKNFREKILIIDFGSQVTKLIARRVRDLNVYSEILPPETKLDQIKEIAPSAIILSGGPSSVFTEEAPTFDKNIFYVESENALGIDQEGTVDGVHFTDLGFMRYADFLLEKFKGFELIKH